MLKCTAALLGALLFLAPAATAQPTCDAEHKPVDSRCTGCPPMRDGKLCASTTRYNDLTKGACGCGTEPNGRDYWSKSMFTAALNAKNLDPATPSLGWCPHNCGQCFQLCSTGGATNSRGGQPESCIVVKVENRCGDGYPGQDNWCRQTMSYDECQRNPSACRQRGATNNYGYSAHFDLQDANLQIEQLGWDNAEVTFEAVSCDGQNYPDWRSNCQCESPFA